MYTFGLQVLKFTEKIGIHKWEGEEEGIVKHL